MFSGTAAALVRGRVSAVAAMQYEISDTAAVAFSRGFYGAIAQGRGVDEAVSSGRTAIVGLSGRTLEWVTPVLYLRGHDSRLFSTPAATLPEPQQQRSAAESADKQPVRPGHADPPPAPGPARVIRKLKRDSRRERLIDTIWSPPGMAAVAFSPGGDLIATAGNRTVQLWDPATGKHIRALGHYRWVRAVAFSPGGDLLATGSDD